MKKILQLLVVALPLLWGAEDVVAQHKGHYHHKGDKQTMVTMGKDVNQYGLEVCTVPLTAEAQDGFLVLYNKAADYRIWFDVRVQTDGAVFFGESNGADPIGDGVSLRRARFAVKGQLREDLYGELDVDFANGVLELKDAYMRYDGLENFAIQVGNFKENFSMQVNTTSRYLQFIERPMATAFAPSRHLGMQVNYNRPAFWATAGVFFQPIEDAEVRANVEDNNKDYGRGPGHSWTGKVVVRPLYEMNEASLHIGFSASYRTPKADMSPSKWGSARISSRNATNINRKKYLDTGNIADVNFEMMMSAELAGHWKGLRWEAAYLADNVHVEANTEGASTKHFYGIYAQAGYLLFGGRQNYDAGGAKYTRITPGRDWGDVEVCARFDRLDLDSQGIYGGAANAWTVGVNYYVNPNIKMMVNYQYVKNNKYANGNGKLLVGYDAEGTPTTNPADVDSAKGFSGVGYNMLSCRFEVNF